MLGFILNNVKLGLFVLFEKQNSVWICSLILKKIIFYIRMKRYIKGCLCIYADALHRQPLVIKGVITREMFLQFVWQRVL